MAEGGGVASFYDRKWRRRRRLNVPSLLRRREVLRLIARHGGRPPLRLVELGCGQGELARRLAAFGPTVAVDLSPETIAANRPLAPAVEFLCADVTDEELPERLGRFDVVVSSEVIEHVELDRRDGFLANLARLAAPGGLAVLTTPSLDHLDRLRRPGEDRQELARRLDDQPVNHYLYRDELLALASPWFTPLATTTVHPLVRRRPLDLAWKAALLPTGYRGAGLLTSRLGVPGTYLVAALRRHDEPAPG